MSMAKYRLIYQALLEDIRNGTYRLGALLPGEHELMEQYGASRDTIRKALSILSSDGYIQRRQGLGSTVWAMSAFPFLLMVSTASRKRQKGWGKKYRPG